MKMFIRCSISITEKVGFLNNSLIRKIGPRKSLQKIHQNSQLLKKSLYLGLNPRIKLTTLSETELKLRYVIVNLRSGVLCSGSPGCPTILDLNYSIRPSNCITHLVSISRIGVRRRGGGGGGGSRG